MSTEDEKTISIGDLYPDLTANEWIEAEENVRRYLDVVKRIFDYVYEQKPEILTELRRRATLRKEKKV
jgi:hypothetical protein